MQPHNSQPQSLGSLFSANIFGNHANVSASVKPIRKPKNTPATRTEKVTFTSLVEDVQPVMAVHPYINSTAFAATMDNYRLYIAKYNEMVEEINIEIEKENAAVRTFIATGKMNEVQKQFSKIFLLRNKNKETKEYNELVAEFNKDRGNVLEKRKHLTVKYASEIVFQQMIYLYSIQLQKTSNEYLKLGVTETSPVRQMEVNAHHITNLKRNEVHSINVCRATIRNHRKRLEEAGVFVDYLFRGHKTGLKMHVSSQILVVFDAKTQLLTSTDNQAVTSQRRKEVTDNNEDTRTIKSNINKRENGQADFPLKGTATPDFSFVFYKSIQVQSSEPQTPGGGENVKVSKTLSEKLETSVLHNQNFAEKLANGDYNGYKRIDKRILYKEATYGTMGREEFKTLIVQEFFKNAAKLYRGKTPFVGSWKKAINTYMEKLFTVNNGNVHLYKKELMVDKLDEMIWRLNNAQKWFLKTGINPLYPSDYFDFTRTEKKEIGFEYTKLAYKNHLKYIEDKPKLAKAVVKKSTIRKTGINHAKKFDMKVNAFFKNRIELPELIEYVDKNLPENYLQKLSDTLLKVSTKYTC
ncbi:hypothetical protein SAMN05443667_101269 [Flavobacterium gillisiae]|uniref:Uncharacterized protein n=1 Tax=Flavobacterium gillisiae TaxID=150146 RepID=A0A1H3WW59_9FLAO|nr:hypothetical protein [Flavobacterium gillisiae]SDZ91363.1 hypothetical protein SAMN05443667_101269 [Flavobacterium gillisiae]